MLRRAFLLLALCAACAQTVGDIDRTQPGRIHKSALAGEWLFRQTVVDVPYTATYTWIGEQNIAELVRFNISEHYLTAYRTHEYITGSEAPYVDGGTEYTGAPIAQYEILSHFDVLREYNEDTGEQSNVIVENDTDRPWYEREYVRVNWSQNLIANFNFLVGSVKQSPSAYFVDDPASPDHMVMAVRDGAGWRDVSAPFEMNALDGFQYFDVVNKLFLEPEELEYWYDDYYYELFPACWDWLLYGRFDCTSAEVKIRNAFLKVERDSGYVPLDYPDNVMARDDQGEPIATMWDEDLEATRRCEPGDDPVYCTQVRIPYFDKFGYFRVDRETYDPNYEVTVSGRTHLITRWGIWENEKGCVDPAAEFTHAACRVKPIVYYLSADFPDRLKAVAYESIASWNSALQDTVRSLTGWEEIPTVFELRDNSGQREGDLRYSHLSMVRKPQFDSLLGYGPSVPHPLTGEIIAADAYVYGAAIESYAAWTMDLIDLMNGTIDPLDFIEGENVRAAVSALRDGSNVDEPAFSLDDVHAFIDGQIDPGRLESLRRDGKDRLQTRRNWARGRLGSIADTPFEDKLMNKELELAFRRGKVASGGSVAPHVGGTEYLREAKRRRQELARHNVELGEYLDDALVGLARALRELPREEAQAQVEQLIFRSTAEHEVGHTLGLRHNFEGSFDALNYKDEYWQLKGESSPAFTPPTDEQMSGRMPEYAYASIMDYAMKINGDVHGIGKYDRAAIKFGYGQLVEVFDEPLSIEEQPILDYLELPDVVHEAVHYTRLPEFFGGLERMQARHDVPYSEVIEQLRLESRPGVFSEVPYRFCSDEYDGTTATCSTWDAGADSYEIVRNAADAYRSYYIVNAFQRDRRFVDPWDYYTSSYWHYFIHFAVQYQNWVWDQWDASSTWEYLADTGDYLGVDLVEDRDWNRDLNGGAPRVAATMEALNVLTEILAMPEPGAYFFSEEDSLLLNFDYAEWEECEEGVDSVDEDGFIQCSALNVPLGTGRYAFTEYDGDAGYYFYEDLHVVGSFYDKLLAIETLTDPTTYFLGLDSDQDISGYAIGFYLMFPKLMHSVVGGVIADDASRFAGRVVQGDYEAPKLFVPGELSGLTDDDVRPAFGTFVDPATSFTVQAYAMYYGMALFASNFDMTFTDTAQIFLDGSGEGVTLPDPDDAEIETFENPFNHRVYHAIRHSDPGFYSTGYEMLERANRFRDQWEDAVAGGDPYWIEDSRYRLQSAVENIELIRGLHDIYGLSWF